MSKESREAYIEKLEVKLRLDKNISCDLTKVCKLSHFL